MMRSPFCLPSAGDRPGQTAVRPENSESGVVGRGGASYHLKGTAENDYVTPKERQQYLFCRVTRGSRNFRIHIIRPQGSAMIRMACEANALAVVPVGVGRGEAGAVMAFRWLK